jgi:predicted RecA/RadA family phage recombinase
MGTSYLQPGEVLEFTAPGGGVTKGVPVIIGSQIVIPIDTVAATLPFRGYTTGVHSVPKAPSQAWTEGQAVYLDSGNGRFSNATTVGFYRAGVAVEAVGSGAGETTGKVRLTGEVTFAVSATYVQR